MLRQLRIWGKKMGQKITKRFNGGSWFAELKGDEYTAYKIVNTFTLIGPIIVEVIKPLDPSYLDQVIRADQADQDLSDWGYFQVQSEQQVEQISQELALSQLDKERILLAYRQEMEDKPFQQPRPLEGSAQDQPPPLKAKGPIASSETRSAPSGRASKPKGDRRGELKPSGPQRGQKRSQPSGEEGLEDQQSSREKPLVQERSLPSRKSPAHISGRLMQPLLIIDS
jgi:hypothetical protein